MEILTILNEKKIHENPQIEERGRTHKQTNPCKMLNIVKERGDNHT